MKHLKQYSKINESAFDTSTIEDILCEVTDEGFGWDISSTKSSKGRFTIAVYIIATSEMRIDSFKDITSSILRIDKYLKSEGYSQADDTVDIIDEIENDEFYPSSWISISEEDDSESFLQLVYKKK